MKRATSFFIVLLITVFCLLPKVNAYEFNIQNLISQSNTSITITSNENLETIVSLSSLDYIEVEENQEYYLIPTYINQYINAFGWMDLPLFSKEVNLNLSLYDEDKSKTFLNADIKNLENIGYVCGYSITIPNGVSYLKFDDLELYSPNIKASDFVNIYNSYFESVERFILLTSINNISKIDSNYQSEFTNHDSINISNLKLSDNLDIYKSAIDESKNIILSDLNYYTSVNNPISVENFMTEISLQAIDEIDGDRTSLITYEANSYLSNVINKPLKERTLGNHLVTFSVKDNSNNEAICSFNINVVDEEKPVLDVENSILEYNLEFEDPHLTIDDITNNIVVTDNYDLSHSVLTNEYEGNEDVIGAYPVNLIYQDSSGNSIVVNVRININDSIAPVINSNSDVFDTSYVTNHTLEDILQILNVNVTDNYLTGITYKIDLNEYTGNEKTVGTYLVKLSAKDTSNNITTKNITITIYDDIPPVFYYNETKVNVFKNEILTINDFKEILINRTLVKEEDFVVEVISDNYTENKQKAGKYEVGLKVKYEDSEATYHKIIVNVNEDIKEEETLFEKVWTYIKKIFQSIWNIISWPFKKFLGLF